MLLSLETKLFVSLVSLSLFFRSRFESVRVGLHEIVGRSRNSVFLVAISRMAAAAAAAARIGRSTIVASVSFGNALFHLVKVFVVVVVVVVVVVTHFQIELGSNGLLNYPFVLFETFFVMVVLLIATAYAIDHCICCQMHGTHGLEENHCLNERRMGVKNDKRGFLLLLLLLLL